MSNDHRPNDFLASMVEKFFDEIAGKEIFAEKHLYSLCEKIGAGGQGVVFTARRDKEQDADFVVKLLFRQELHDLERGFRELRIGELEHPNLVKAVGIGSNRSGMVGLIFERIYGQSLKDRLAVGSIPQPLLLDWGIQIADVLAFLHERGFIHRDVKPSNILISEADRSVHLADFGLCFDQNANDSLTQDGIPGTLDYMSPELRTGMVLPQSDIYSLGMVLYEAATGKRIRDPDEIGMPNHEFAAVIACCLERSHNNRYAAAKDLKADLESIAIHELPKFARLIQKRKHRRSVFKIAVASLAVVLLGIGIWYSTISHAESPSEEGGVVHFQLRDDVPFRLLSDEDYPKVMSDTEVMQKIMDIHLLFSHPVSQEETMNDVEKK